MTLAKVGPDPQVIESAFVAAAGRVSELPAPTVVEVAFAGRSNVGKSSLMNALLGRHRLVRTSSTPGCTRTVSFFDARFRNGDRLRLVDLPGYGYARRSRAERALWSGLIEAYLLERSALRAVVVLLDVRRDVESDDLELIELLAQPSRVSRPPLGVQVVATKTDRLSRAARQPRLAELSARLGRSVRGVSVHDSTTIDSLWKRLRSLPTLGQLESIEAGTKPSI